MTNWNFDITTAPKGKTVTTDRKFGKEIRKHSEFVPEIVWLASECGKVMRSYWLPERRTQSDTILSHGRWSGFAEQGGKGPVAWHPYEVPVHPNAVSDLGLNIVTKHSEVAA